MPIYEYVQKSYLDRTARIMKSLNRIFSYIGCSSDWSDDAWKISDSHVLVFDEDRYTEDGQFVLLHLSGEYNEDCTHIIKDECPLTTQDVYRLIRSQRV